MPTGNTDYFWCSSFSSHRNYVSCHQFRSKHTTMLWFLDEPTDAPSCKVVCHFRTALAFAPSNGKFTGQLLACKACEFSRTYVHESNLSLAHKYSTAWQHRLRIDVTIHVPVWYDPCVPWLFFSWALEVVLRAAREKMEMRAREMWNQCDFTFP